VIAVNPLPLVTVLETFFSFVSAGGSQIGCFRCRSLAKYYKQNLISRLNPEGKSVLKKIMGHYKALGWTGATGKFIVGMG